MSTPFAIRITKEILDRAKNCGQKEEQSIGDNCAIALALQDLFPDVFVTGDHTHPFGFDQQSVSPMKISLPLVAQNFIKVFDSLVQIPRVRLRLPEFEFDISIPDKILEQINIDEIHNIETVQTHF
jgi:hypothetical protein